MAPSSSPKLDVLRTVAVLTVVCSHLWFQHMYIAHLGRVGVLLFFIHTSLVLMFSLERQDARTGRARLFSSFMVRRILRIYPLAMLVILAVYLFELPAYMFWGRVLYMPTDGFSLGMHLLLVQDAVISRGEKGPLLSVLWTLPIELRMYLFLPLTYLFVRKVRDLRIILSLWTLSALGAIASGWLIARLFGSALFELDRAIILFPRLLEFVPHFLAGVLAYVFWRRATARIPFVTLPIMLALMLVSYWALLQRVASGRVLDLFLMLCSLAIALTLPYVREPVWGPICRVSASVARYSYGIYLVHVPCIWIGFQVLSTTPAPVQWATFIGTTIGLSMILHVFVEAPFIRVGASLGERLITSGTAQRRQIQPTTPVRVDRK